MNFKQTSKHTGKSKLSHITSKQENKPLLGCDGSYVSTFERNPLHPSAVMMMVAAGYFQMPVPIYQLHSIPPQKILSP